MENQTFDKYKEIALRITFGLAAVLAVIHFIFITIPAGPIVPYEIMGDYFLLIGVSLGFLSGIVVLGALIFGPKAPWSGVEMFRFELYMGTLVGTFFSGLQLVIEFGLFQ